MNRKYFLLDKNYILKEAQQAHQDRLLKKMIDQVVATYLSVHNPLGLIDDTVLKISRYKPGKIDHLYELYDLLAGIFRYHIGTNQLEFLFDGVSHYEKYEADWIQCYERWLSEFSRNERFLKMVLSLTVFYQDEHSASMALSRLKYFISNHFNLKLYRYKGIMSMNVA